MRRFLEVLNLFVGTRLALYSGMQVYEYLYLERTDFVALYVIIGMLACMICAHQFDRVRSAFSIGWCALFIGLAVYLYPQT